MLVRSSDGIWLQLCRDVLLVEEKAREREREMSEGWYNNFKSHGGWMPLNALKVDIYTDSHL